MAAGGDYLRLIMGWWHGQTDTTPPTENTGLNTLQWDTIGYGRLHWTTEGLEPPPLQWNEIANRPVHWS